MGSITYPKTPFKQTALCFSGGGYRAASFHLGTLSYLRHISFRGRPLLEFVKVISTISGGTFTGVLYAHSLWESRHVEDDELRQTDEEFVAFYRRLKGFMADEDLLKLALDKLGKHKEWQDGRRRNVINAFAKVYQERLFGDSQYRSFDLFYHSRTHLEEVMFNATEFSYGLAFRFQKTLGDRGLIGNWYRSVPTAAAREIRLGDIIAASSCFPAGFEPIAFPHDFIGPESKYLRMLSSEEELKDIPLEYESDKIIGRKPFSYFYPQPIALMDGGIVDNQGIESIILSEKRREKEEESEEMQDPEVSLHLEGERDREIDLFIISDVASPFLDPLGLAQQKEAIFSHIQKDSVSQLYHHLSWGGFLSVLLLIPVLVHWLGWIEMRNWLENLLLVLGVGSGAVTLSLLIVINYFKRQIIKVQVPVFFRSTCPFSRNCAFMSWNLCSGTG